MERAFRITKGTLEVRPMFHFSEKRIEAHVCICFVTLDIDLPENGKTLTKTIYTSKEERDIAYLIETDDWLNKIG